MRWHLCALTPLVIGLSACAALETAEETQIETAPRFALTHMTQWQANVEFEDVAIGARPADWLATPGATWEVMQGPEVPSRSHVLGVSAPAQAPRSAVHLLWAPQIAFENGSVQVDALPRAGGQCQSAGVAWRIQDAENYYVCRWDALAHDLILGVVVNGQMRTLGSWATDLPGQAWRRIRVEHTGSQIEVQFAGATRLQAQDGTLMRAGGVGLWTEGDSRSAFDGLIVQRGE